MLSSKTYAVWNVTVAVLAVLFGLGSVMGGQHAIGIAEFVMAAVFIGYAVMAYLGKGMFTKHPTTIKPNGEVVAKEHTPVTVYNFHRPPEETTTYEKFNDE